MATNTARLPYRRRPTDQSSQMNKKKQLFAAKTPNPKDVDSEIVKTECLGKGFRLIGKTLGEGAYAKVTLAEVSAAKLARHKGMSDSLEGNAPYVAIKIINKKTVPNEFLKKFLPRELDNHSRLPHHANVVQVFEHFSTPDQVFMVLEYCEKGDLLDHINNAISNNQRGLGEDITKKIFRQMSLGVQHIHSHYLVHRDLKCENILITADNTVKITDFGFSCRFEDRTLMLKTSCGSYAYTAPEVIKNKPYDGFRSDIWSLGIILFAMVNGRLPYNDSQLTEMDEDMRMQRLRFERSVSFDCMVLIRKMLQYNPLLRPTVYEVLTDAWITGKKPIPRQLKPKWINPYYANKDAGQPDKDTLRVDGAASEKSSPVCSRDEGAVRARTTSTPQATVTINQRAGETVTLKSRVKQQKHTSNEPRPQTWPKTRKERKNENDRLARRRGKTASPQKCDRQQGTDRLTQLLELTKDSRPRPETGGREYAENSVPLWYMYKMIQNSNKQSSSKRSQSEEKQNGAKKTGSRQMVCHTVHHANPKKQYWSKSTKHGGTVNFHNDTHKNILIEKLDKIADQQEQAGESGDTALINSPPPGPVPSRQFSNHRTPSPTVCRERFIRIYGPNTPQYVKEYPLPPLLVQRLNIQENNPKVKQDAERRQACSAPVTGNNSPEPATSSTVTSRSHKACASSARGKPVYKVVYHAS